MSECKTVPVTLLEQALDALLHRSGGSDQQQRIDAAITGLCAALAQKQAETVQKPVAVVRSVVGQGDEGVRIKWLGGFPQIGDRLYTAPPKTEPPTDDEIMALWERHIGPISFARAVIARTTQT